MYDHRGWIRHARRYFPRGFASENTQCDVDENMLHNRQERMDESYEYPNL